MKKQYTPRDEKRDFILRIAMELARKDGFSNLTRAGILRHCDKIGKKVAAGSINYCVGDVNAIKDEVMRSAIAAKELKIIAEGIVDNHEMALNAPKELRQAALNSML